MKSATTVCPTARWVCKADDDVWIHLAGMEAYLSDALVSLGPSALLYFGLMETYSWDQRPVSIVAREGVQTGFVAKARVHTMDSWAKASRCGVEG